MTTLFRARQRAEEFAALVDGTSAVRSAAGPRTERLVEVATLLRAHGETDPLARPREDFAVDLRERLMAEAATVLTPQNAGLALPHRTRSKRERRLVAVASAAVLLGGTAGMATAAQNALPGEALYPIKRGLESAEAGLSTSSSGRGRDLLHQASGRLDEVHGLLAAEPATGAPQVPHTLRTFNQQATDGADLLMAAYQKDRDPATIAAVRRFAAAGLGSIEALADVAPAAAQPALRDAALALRDIDARAARLCAACADLPALQLPPTFLASAEVDRAMQQVQAAKLDNSHPVIVEKQVARQVKAPTGPTRGGGEDGGAAAPEAAVTAGPLDEAPLSGVPGQPGEPKVRVKADLDGGRVTEDVTKKVTGDLGDGLGGVVETLLPDPVTDLLP
jgi:hypothetical protein